MKKLLVAVIVMLGLVAYSAPVFAADGVTAWTVTLSTAARGEDSNETKWLTDYEAIDGTKRITKLELVYLSTTVATTQTVTIGEYDSAVSTKTFTTLWTRIGNYVDANTNGQYQTVTYDFVSPTSGSNQTYLKVSNLMAKKSSVNSPVQMTIWYLK